MPDSVTAIAPAVFSAMVRSLDKRRAAFVMPTIVNSDSTVFIHTGSGNFSSVTRLGIHNK